MGFSVILPASTTSAAAAIKASASTESSFLRRTSLASTVLPLAIFQHLLISRGFFSRHPGRCRGVKLLGWHYAVLDFRQDEQPILPDGIVNLTRRLHQAIPYVCRDVRAELLVKRRYQPHMPADVQVRGRMRREHVSIDVLLARC